MALGSRSESLGFAERTRKNLEHIQHAYHSGADVHVVTQTINSLLGLIVFPWEQGFEADIKNKKLDQLEKEGWPRWRVTKGHYGTLGELIKNLRNAAAHRNLTFSSDSRDAKHVKIEIWNRKSKNSKNKVWEAHISASDLRVFCLKFIELLEQTIG